MGAMWEENSVQEGLVIAIFKKVLFHSFRTASKVRYSNMSHLCDEIGRCPQEDNDQEEADAMHVISTSQHRLRLVLVDFGM